MTFRQELASWASPSPPSIPIATAPSIGSKAPSTSQLPVPSEDGRPMIITFLRHCGCPFAEATFMNMRERAAQHPEISFIAISHSTSSHTAKWLEEIGGPGTTNPIRVIIDESREIYAAYGLGTSSFMHVLSPSGLAAVRTLGKSRGIWNRPTESGSRWQMGGNFGVDSQGVVRWGGVSGRADEMPTFEEAVGAVRGAGGESARL